MRRIIVLVVVLALAGCEAPPPEAGQASTPPPARALPSLAWEMAERFKTLCFDREPSAVRFAADTLGLRRADGLTVAGMGRAAPGREVFIPRQGTGYFLTLEAGPPPRCVLGAYRLSVEEAEATLDVLAQRLREQGLRPLPGERRVQPNGRLVYGIRIEGPGPRRRVMTVGPQFNPGSAITVVFQAFDVTGPMPPRVEPPR